MKLRLVMEEKKETISVHTEGTPNPNALKFVFNKTFIEKGSHNFTSIENCKNSPLAEKLFKIAHVNEVFIGKDFITITKKQDIPWENIYDQILHTIDDHLYKGEPIIINTHINNEKGKSEIEQKILDLLDNQIRPAVAADGGDIIFDSYEDGILKLHLQGACSSCPSSIMTLKAGIEGLLKKQIPELKEVISI